MSNQKCISNPNRRLFLKKVISAGIFTCFGYHGLKASPNSDKTDQHKFSNDSEMNFDEVFSFAYQDWFIPFMQKLSVEIGERKFIDMLKKVSSEIAAEGAKKWVNSIQDNDFLTFTSSNKNSLLNGSLWKNILTHETIKDAATEYEVKITECLWAKTFKEANAADIGYACFCHQDFNFTKAFNSKIKLSRTKTLMQGHKFCNFRWTWEG